jgi:hypothetical protein
VAPGLAPTRCVRSTRCAPTHSSSPLAPAQSSYVSDEEGRPVLKKGTGGSFSQRLRPGDMLDNLVSEPPPTTLLICRPFPCASDVQMNNP